MDTSEPDLLTAQQLGAIRRLAAAKHGRMDPEEMLSGIAPQSYYSYAGGGVVRHNSGNKVGVYHGKDEAFRKEYKK
jgi:hypothetical protein